MSKLFLRQGRILPGPLKALPRAERRSPVPVTSLALSSAAIAACLVLVPHVAPRPSLDPAATAAARAETASVSASPVPGPASPQLQVVAMLASEPARASAAPAEVVDREAVVRTAPAAGRSLFERDLLPVLTADALDLDTGPASPPAPAKGTTRPARRAAAASRGHAFGDPSQP